MCGIAGYFGDKPFLLIEQMAAAIAHRGPDNIGIYRDPRQPLSLAHTRLSIIDLSPASNQPLWDVTGRFCVVFNGEIYNYRALRVNLEKRGYKFLSDGDAEVLLNLYIEYREKALSLLNGIFAFAIWDTIDRELFVARDHLGVKPLYFSETSAGFVFSSELKSLLCDTSISRDLDFAALRLYVQYLWSPAPLTPLKAVKKMLPGEYCRVRDGRVIERHQYYYLPDKAAEKLSLADSKNLLLDTLRESIERQLVSDVNVGAFLSGGLDSSAVVAFAAQKTGAKNLPCFTIRYDGGAQEGMTEDLPYAQRAAEHLKVPLHIIDIKPDIIHDFPRLIFQLDEPQADLAPLNAFYISRMAREMGIKVLLSGAGGDDILTGYRRHYALQQEKYWSWMPPSSRGLLRAATDILPKTNPLFRRISKAFHYADLDEQSRIASYFWWLDPLVVEQLFAQPLIQGVDPLRDYLDNLRESHLSGLQKMLRLDTRFFLSDHNFNYTDKVSMVNGVEVRVPLVDMEMIKTAARIPDEFKQYGREGKWIFKKVMEPFLPHDVIYRPKTGFGAPLRTWLRGDLKATVDELLSETTIRQRGIFNYQVVKNLLDADRMGQIDAAYPILAIMSIEIWCRQFIDLPVPQNITI
jgi:asparagine synthase (glutamine-hydrolysing)